VFFHLVSGLSVPAGSPLDQRQWRYGWVIVVAGTLMMAISYGLMYSYSVFFKPLADYFHWDRATVSSVYSVSLIFRGVVSIGIGWLADRYGAARIMALCGFLIGLGLGLSSQVHTLWQFFLTYALIEAAGLSGTFGIVTALVSRWFTQNRGLALGIVSSGVGLGTLLVVPGAERLITALDWSWAFIICGATSGVIMIAAAFLLRPAPPIISSPKNSLSSETDATSRFVTPQADVTLWEAVRTMKMIVLLAAFCLFFFCTQMVTVHLVNYATDKGITPLIAASFISIIGVISIAGRLSTGTGSDRIGINNTLILTRVFLVISFILLIFTRQLWTFYLFAVIFGFTYGGEVPQIPLFVGRFFGTGTMATLMGLTIFVGNIGGALGPWVAGAIFDSTRSYFWAFVVGAVAGLASLILALILKRITGEQQVKS
jgi:MFS family permease